ncbi:MAG TPA: NfeD family protein [Steroidobacteraceae bacterium]|nr:NfeD family protein [Steroidobacteraceae bacterium]
MTEWFASHNSVEQMFLLAATVGGIILVFRLILTIAGLDHHGGADAVHVDSDDGFQALTIQGISSFFAMFGVVGYTLYHNAALGMVLALSGAIAAGVVSVWIVHKIFRSMLRLQSSGTVSLFAAVGSEGSVYLTVGKDGGRVQINFANRLREFEAVSADGATIPTGTPIRVQSVTANTLVVAPVDR